MDVEHIYTHVGWGYGGRGAGAFAMVWVGGYFFTKTPPILSKRRYKVLGTLYKVKWGFSEGCGIAGKIILWDYDTLVSNKKYILVFFILPMSCKSSCNFL